MAALAAVAMDDDFAVTVIPPDHANKSVKRHATAMPADILRVDKKPRLDGNSPLLVDIFSKVKSGMDDCDLEVELRPKFIKLGLSKPKATTTQDSLGLAPSSSSRSLVVPPAVGISSAMSDAERPGSAFPFSVDVDDDAFLNVSSQQLNANIESNSGKDEKAVVAGK